MDLRIRKTEKFISSAFIELRKTKPLNKITVKELCEKAEINKSTFYMHYRDIFDLSDKLENDIIKTILSGIPYPEKAIEDPKEYSNRLFRAFMQDNPVVSILFSGNRQAEFAGKLTENLRQLILSIKPDYRNNPSFNVCLSYMVFGGYYAMLTSNNQDIEKTIEAIGLISAYSSHMLIGNKTDK